MDGNVECFKAYTEQEKLNDVCLFFKLKCVD